MKLRDLTDIEQLQHLCTSFSDMSGITTAILELDGEILVAAGGNLLVQIFIAPIQ